MRDDDVIPAATESGEPSPGLRERAEQAGLSREEADRVVRATRRVAETETALPRGLGADLARAGYCAYGGPPDQAPLMARPSFSQPPPTPEGRARHLAEQLRWLPKPFRQLDFGPDLAPYVAGGAERVAAVLAAFAEAEARGRRARRGSVVLVGPSGTGKTAIACAWIRRSLVAGRSARFVPALKLGTVREMDDGRSVPWERFALATDLVLDDLGAELAGAAPEAGIAAVRREATIRVLYERYDRALPQVVTTPHTKARLRELYGDNVARRVYEGAAVIKLGK